MLKIVIIHGQSHKGSTYHIARSLAEKLEGEITEFFLPRDFNQFCVGCTQCFIKSETLCPHYEKLKPITDAIDRADVIILASPVYVFHATGAMKVFLDHYGYRWMVHRPDEAMFRKQAVCISTSAGAGTKSTNKDMADSLFFWGVARIYKYGLNVAATSWEQVTPERKTAIEEKTTQLSRRIRNNFRHLTPALKTRAFFFLMHLLERNGWCKADVEYWKAKGWTGSIRPWKQSSGPLTGDIKRER